MGSKREWCCQHAKVGPRCSLAATTPTVSSRPSHLEEEQEANGTDHTHYPHRTGHMINVTFLPGQLGLIASRFKGYVSELNDDGQARAAGVQVGWFIVQVDGVPYSQARLNAKMEGSRPYTISFFDVGDVCRKFMDTQDCSAWTVYNCTGQHEIQTFGSVGHNDHTGIGYECCCNFGLCGESRCTTSSTTTVSPYSCHAEYSHAWSQEQMLWCCSNATDSVDQLGMFCCILLGINCVSPATPSSASVETCDEFDVRLANAVSDGNGAMVGTPEVYHNGNFHPICGHIWDNANGADIICRQLGYRGGAIITLGYLATGVSMQSCPRDISSLAGCTPGWTEGDERCATSSHVALTASCLGNSSVVQSCAHKPSAVTQRSRAKTYDLDRMWKISDVKDVTLWAGWAASAHLTIVITVFVVLAILFGLSHTAFRHVRSWVMGVEQRSIWILIDDAGGDQDSDSDACTLSTRRSPVRPLL